jgi:hypothetical protein
MENSRNTILAHDYVQVYKNDFGNIALLFEN